MQIHADNFWIFQFLSLSVLSVIFRKVFRPVLQYYEDTSYWKE